LGWPAAIGVLVGSVMALAQTDVKRLLAYSSISHVGYIALGLAIGNSDALVGAVLHIVAHSLMKGCLFLIVGGVSYRFGIRVEEGFQHLARKMPVAMAAFVLCALSMMGIPPTIGFFSKWYLLLGALRAGEIGFVVILLVSTLLNAWYFFRLIERIYFGHEEEEGGRPATERELPPSMLGPIAVLASALIVVGTLSYPLADGLLRRPVDSFVGTLERSLEVTFEPSHEWGGRGTRERANVQTLERSLVWKQWSR
jgi:multicomponent Na+:H+ antiporter subunit D